MCLWTITVPEGRQAASEELADLKIHTFSCKAGETHFLGLWPGACKLQSEEQQNILLLWLCHGELSFNLFILTWRYPEQMDMDLGCFLCCFSFHWHWQKVRLTWHWWSPRFTMTNDPAHLYPSYANDLVLSLTNLKQLAFLRDCLTLDIWPSSRAKLIPY